MPIQINSLKIRKSVKDYALYLTFQRALQAFPSFATGAPGLVILLTPPGQAATDYDNCAFGFLTDGLERSDYDDIGYMMVSIGDKQRNIWKEFRERCIGKIRSIVISEVRELDPSIVVAADVAIELEPMSATDLREACQQALKLRMTERQAAQLLTFPQELMFSALRKNRKASEIIARLKSAPAVTTKAEPIEEPSPRLEDLHGYGSAKTWGLQLSADLKLWQAGKLKWSDVDRGLLLSGPPGVGKTIFAKALAQTCGVYFLATSVSQWQSKGHLGDLLKAMRADFTTALDNVPSMIFLDELDSIGDRRDFVHDNAPYSIQVVNGLLECLDGTAKRDGLVVIGATNLPEKIDPAVRRPGRLDRHMVIEMPDAADRVAILRQQLGADCSFDLDELGPLTEAMSGADLAQVVRDAKRLARRDGRAVVLSDLTSQLPQLIPIAGAYRRSVAAHEAGHTVVGTRLARGKFHGVYISKQLNPRFALQNAGGAAFEVPVLCLRNEKHYRDEICVRLAGIAAEKLIFGSHDDGAGNGPRSDLAQATNLALEMETKTGMGKRLFQFGQGTSWDEFGPQQVPWLMDRVNQILLEELARAQDILERERPLLNAVTEVLDKLGSVSPERLEELREAVNGGGITRPNNDAILNADKFRAGNEVTTRKGARK